MMSGQKHRNQTRFLNTFKLHPTLFSGLLNMALNDLRTLSWMERGHPNWRMFRQCMELNEILCVLMVTDG